MIHDFETARPLRLLDFIDFLLHAVHDFLDLHLLSDLGVEPVHSSDVRAIVEAKLRVVAEEFCNGVGMANVHAKRWLIGRGLVANNFHARAANAGFEPSLHLFQSFQFGMFALSAPALTSFASARRKKTSTGHPSRHKKGTLC